MGYVYEELTVAGIARRLCADPNAGWSINGAFALAEYLQEVAEDTKEPIELDIVALRCDFSEYESLEAFNADYFAKGAEDDWYRDIDALRDDAGTVLEFDGGIIVASF